MCLGIVASSSVSSAQDSTGGYTLVHRCYVLNESNMGYSAPIDLPVLAIYRNQNSRYLMIDVPGRRLSINKMPSAAGTETYSQFPSSESSETLILDSEVITIADTLTGNGFQAKKTRYFSSEKSLELGCTN